MKIIITSLNLVIYPEYLSGGELTEVTRIADKANRGHELKPKEEDFARSMAARSNVTI